MDKVKISKEWRVTIICPLYKKGNIMNYHNFRGILLPSIMYKILPGPGTDWFIRFFSARDNRRDRLSIVLEHI